MRAGDPPPWEWGARRTRATHTESQWMSWQSDSPEMPLYLPGDSYWNNLDVTLAAMLWSSPMR